MSVFLGRTGHGPREFCSLLAEKVLPAIAAAAASAEALSKAAAAAVDAAIEMERANPELECSLRERAAQMLCDEPFSGILHETVARTLSCQEFTRAQFSELAQKMRPVWEAFLLILRRTTSLAPLRGAQLCLTAGWQRLPCSYTVAKVSTGIGLGYAVFTAGRMIFQRRSLDSLGSENLPFIGDARQPYCLRCTPAIANGLDAGRGWKKSVTIKTRCHRCCRFPQLFAADKHVEITISDEIHRSVNMYSCLQLGRNRDTHGPMETVLDNLPNHDHNSAMLMNLIGRACTSEHIYRRWFGFVIWNEHTDSYMMATPWRHTPGAAPAARSESRPASLNPPTNSGRRNWRNFQHISAFMRPYWEWVFQHNDRLPQVSLVSPDHTVLDAHSNADTAGADRLGLQRTLPQTLIQGGDITAERPEHRPMLASTAKDLVFEAKSNAVKCGPLLSKPLVHNTGDTTHVSSGVESRTLPEPGHTYDKDSPSARRLSRFWCKMQAANFTPYRIKEAFLSEYGDVTSLSELKLSGFSQAEIDEAAQKIVGYRNIGKLPKRKGNGKLELVEKSAGEEYKAVRITYDNGLELLTLCCVITKIFQSLIYGKELGMFYKQSIKGRPRDEVIQELLHRWIASEGETCGFEIDQTGMERHTRGNTRSPGLMSPVYTILKKICNVICKECLSTHATKYETKLIIDHTHGLCFNIKVKTGVKNQTQSLLVRFDDLYLDSGWSMTSGVNFINELSGLLATCFENPEHVFVADKAGKMYILQNDERGKCLFDWEFRTVNLYVNKDDDKLDSVKTKFDPSVEGDDGGGIIGRIFSDPRNQKIIEANQKSLGYAAKLKFVTDGRLEYIGIHMRFQNGKPFSTSSWCPGIMRSLGKLGAKTGNDNSPQAQLARFLSIGTMFSSTIQPMCESFVNSGQRILDQIGEHLLEEEIVVKEWDDLWKAGACEGKHTLLKIYDNACEKMASTIGPPMKDQIQMINTSIFQRHDGEFTGEHFARLQYFASQLQFSDEDEANFCSLPLPMWPRPPGGEEPVPHLDMLD